MQFLTIPSHEQEKKDLIHLVENNKTPHAQLFWGVPGSPTLLLAVAFATYLHCTNKLPEDACGHCRACLKMQNLSHPDVRFSFPIQGGQPTSNEINSNHFIKIWHKFLQQNPYGDAGSWRVQLGSLETKTLLIPKAEVSAIRHYLQTPPIEGKCKINIIWLPEYFHLTTANLMLKILEEPPSYTIFLLVSMYPQKLLGTILSRLQSFYVSPFTPTTIADLLERQHKLPRDKIAAITKVSDGNLQKAHDLLELGKEPFFKEIKDWLRFSYIEDLPKLLKIVEKWQVLPKEKQKYLLTYILHIMRLTLLERFCSALTGSFFQEEKVFTQKLSATLDYVSIEKITTWLTQAYYYLERNMNTKITFLNLTLQVLQLFAAIRQQSTQITDTPLHST